MKKWTYFAIGFCFCVLVFGSLTWKLNTSSGTTKTEEYYQKIRNGLAEINLPTSNDAASIYGSPDRIARFIQYRSGVQISESNRNLLRVAEQNAWNSSRRVDANTLTRIITEIAMERLQTLSDSEIESITNSLRGLDIAGAPEAFQNGRSVVKLRASGNVRMSADSFELELRKLRDGGNQNVVAENLIHVSIASEVNRHIETLRNADDRFFGGAERKMTPAQALLVTYAVLTDDPLTYKEGELTQEMESRQQFRSRALKDNFPSPVGYKAYGDNGYLFSSPTSILLNDSSVERLLNLIQERGN